MKRDDMQRCAFILRPYARLLQVLVLACPLLGASAQDVLPPSAALASNNLIEEAFQGRPQRIEQFCYNMGDGADVTSPVFAERLLVNLERVLGDIQRDKNAQIQLVHQIQDILRTNGGSATELEAFLVVNRSLRRDLQEALESLPSLVNDPGPKIVLGLAAIRQLKDRVVQDNELVERTVLQLVSSGRLELKLLERWREITRSLAANSKLMGSAAETWLFCHQNILPDLKTEFSPTPAKRRYRHLVIFPLAKTLAGGNDIITMIGDVYGRMASRDSMTQLPWWKQMAAIQRLVALNDTEEVLRKWDDLLKDIRRDSRPVLINHVVDWALAGDPVFSDATRAAAFLRLMSLREQTQSQRKLVEQLASFNRREHMAELEKERRKLLSMYSDFVSHFMRVAADSAPLINKFNQLAGMRDSMINKAEKLIGR